MSKKIFSLPSLWFSVCLLLLLFSLIKIFLTDSVLQDFDTAYYKSGISLQNGLNPYLTTGNINYPPPALLILSFLHFIPLLPAKIIWTASSLLALLLSLWLIVKITAPDRAGYWFFLLSPLAFLSFPARFTFGMGQINHFILLFFVLWFYYYLRNNWITSSFFLSLSLLFKLTPICLPLILVPAKNRYPFIWLLIFSAILLTISFSFLPVPVFTGFFRIIPAGLGQFTSNSYYYNQSLSALIGRIFGSQPLLYFFSVLLVLLVSLFAVFKSQSVSLRFSILVTAGVLIFPLSWQHQLVYLFAPLIITFFAVRDNRRHLVILILSYLLIILNIPEPRPYMSSVPGNLLLSHAAFGTLILFILNLRYNFKNKKGLLV